MAYEKILAHGAINEHETFDWSLIVTDPNMIYYGLDMILTPEEIFNYIERVDIAQAVTGAMIGADKTANNVKLFRNYEKKYGKSIPHQVIRSFPDEDASPGIIRTYRRVQDISAVLGEQEFSYEDWSVATSKGLPKSALSYVVASKPADDGRIHVSVIGVAIKM